jgi:histidinol-phosphatase
VKPYQEELQLALHMASEAAQVIRRHFRTGLQVETKRDNSPVTLADRGAEEVIRDLMRKHTPDYGIIGEEFGNQAGSSEREWVIDPIDGTKAFIHGVPLFGTMLALLEKGKAVLGVIQLPALGHILHATAGGGAWVDGQPARVSQVPTLEDALILDGSSTTMERLGHGSAWGELRRRAKLHRGWGDCYGHFLVATGGAELMADPIVEIWDIAALQVILPEAGGRFTSFAGHDSITERTAITSNGRFHDPIVHHFSVSASKAASSI